MKILYNNAVCRFNLTFLLFWILFLVDFVWGRGHLIDPPMRSSLWRYYPWSNLRDIPKNTDDGGLNCGGFWKLHEINNGRCGMCGDPYDVRRDNEAGGKFALGHIVRTYYQHEEFMNVTVDIFSNIGGYFEFYLCPNNNISKPITQECIDKYPLAIEGHGLKYKPYSEGKHNLLLKIPDGVTCSQCVLQWKWVGGNNWGICPDGYGGIGCGKQEEYYNCADIAILPTTKKRPTPRPNVLPKTTTAYPKIYPIIPHFVQPSEEFIRFYKNYLSKILKEKKKGKWSENMLSELDKKTLYEKMRSEIQLPKRVFMTSGSTASTKLINVTPSSAENKAIPRPDLPSASLSLSVPNMLNFKPRFSFLDIVRNGTRELFDKKYAVAVNSGVTGKPVFLPSLPPSKPTPGQLYLSAMITRNPVYVDEIQPTPPTTDIPAMVTEPPLMLTNDNVQNSVKSLITNPMQTPTNHSSKTNQIYTSRPSFPDFDYEMSFTTRKTPRDIPSILRPPPAQTDFMSSFLNEIFNAFSPQNLDYIFGSGINYDMPVNQAPAYPMLSAPVDSISAQNPSFMAQSRIPERHSSSIPNSGIRVSNIIPQRNIKNNVNRKNDLSFRAKTPMSSAISNYLSSGNDVKHLSENANSPDILYRLPNQPDLFTQQLSSNDGNTQTAILDSTAKQLNFQNSLFPTL